MPKIPSKSAQAKVRETISKPKWAWWCTPVHPAAQEDRSRGLWSEASLGKKHNNLNENKLEVKRLRIGTKW
jgi:hypothetical protein